MSEVRMSLKEAGELLGLKPNSVRSRYKKGKLRGEADNMGKLWVWVDPTQIANDRGSKSPSSKVTKEPFETKALEGVVKALNEQLEKAQAEIDILRPQATEAVRLEATNAGLRKQIEMVEQRQTLADAEIVRLRDELDKLGDERRKMVEALLKRRPSLWARITGKG